MTLSPQEEVERMHALREQHERELDALDARDLQSQKWERQLELTEFVTAQQRKERR
jgi:hypothetical protein